MSSPPSPASPGSSPSASYSSYEQTRKAIHAIQNKTPKPENIDLTIHVMDDGSQVSTQERVCKGIFLTGFLFLSLLRYTHLIPPSSFHTFSSVVKLLTGGTGSDLVSQMSRRLPFFVPPTRNFLILTTRPSRMSHFSKITFIERAG